VRLPEKGGKRNTMPYHHNLEEYLTAHLAGAGLRNDLMGPLFRTIGRGTCKLTRTVLPRANAYAMIPGEQRRPVSKPSLATTASGQPGSRPTSRTAARLKRTAAMANHASTGHDAALRSPAR
jgi:integrase/recombinase XerC